MQKFKRTKTVWIEKSIMLEFLGGRREFPFMVRTKKDKFVEKRKDQFVEVPMTLEYDALNGEIPGLPFKLVEAEEIELDKPSCAH